MVTLHVDTETIWRGGPQQVLYTVMGLRASGVRAILVAPPDSELFRRMQEGDDLIPLSARADIDMTAAWNLSRIIKQSAPDIVHAHEPRAMGLVTLALSIAAPRPRPSFIVSHRTEARLPHSSFGRWAVSEVDCFIANSQALAARLRKDGVPVGRAVTVHEGIDVDRVQRLEPANVHALLFLPTHAPVVGTVGPLVPQKGLHHLIDAAARVVRAVPDVRVVIVGDGPLRAALEQHIRERHLERHVFLAGFREDAIALIKAFDLFVMSSISEGMCTSLVDAMAADRAAVATDVGGIPEVAVDGETATLVPARDDEAMAAAIVSLLKDDARRNSMGQAALARARAHFTIDQMVQGTITVYQRMLNSPSTTWPAHAPQGTL